MKAVRVDWSEAFSAQPLEVGSPTEAAATEATTTTADSTTAAPSSGSGLDEAVTWALVAVGALVVVGILVYIVTRPDVCHCKGWA